MTNEEKALIRTYTDTCNIYEFKSVGEDAFTKTVKIKTYEDIKCALSQKSLKTTGQSNLVNNINYDAKLFISPSIMIKAGSNIEVKSEGRILNFVSVGESFKYTSHQEILLLRKDKA